MSLFDKAFNRIEENSYKKHNCIPFSEKFPKLSEYLPGPQQGRYYLVSGASGSGKSQLTDDLFLFTPIDFVLEHKTDIEIKIFYYSIELDGEAKMHQWQAKKLFTNYGIRTGVDILKSVGSNRVNDNIKMTVKETKLYFDRFEQNLIFREGSFSPQAIIDEVESYALNNGTTHEKEEVVDLGDGRKEVRNIFNKYVPKKPNEYVIIIVDHAGLLSLEHGLSIKQCIEKLSRYFITIKNKYNYIPVLIQQQSADSENVDHFKAGKLEPSKSTLGESKLTYNDSDIALGIFQPQKHEIKTYRGYNIIDMGDHYRNFSVFKNRFGISNVNVGMYFDGAINLFKELPRKDDINSSHYEMIKKHSPRW